MSVPSINVDVSQKMAPPVKTMLTSTSGLPRRGSAVSASRKEPDSSCSRPADGFLRDMCYIESTQRLVLDNKEETIEEIIQKAAFWLQPLKTNGNLSERLRKRQLFIDSPAVGGNELDVFAMGG